MDKSKAAQTRSISSVLILRLLLMITSRCLLASAAPASVKLLGTLTYPGNVRFPAEQVAFDDSNKVAYVVGVDKLLLIDLKNLAQPSVLKEYNLSGTVNDVAFCANRIGKFVAVSLAPADPPVTATTPASTGKTFPGRVELYTAFKRPDKEPQLIQTFTVGFLPDQLVFSKNCDRIFTANEGEPNQYTMIGTDPVGSVSIINLSLGWKDDTYYACGKSNTACTVQTAGFDQFNAQESQLISQGLRTRPGKTAASSARGVLSTLAQDVEPECVAMSPNGKTAYVALQENNAIAVLDIASATITGIAPLGFKNHNLDGNELDTSDQDPALGCAPETNPNRSQKISKRPVQGMYMPDGITVYSVGGHDMIVTANEGDGRDYTGYTDEPRVATLNFAAALGSNNASDANSLKNAAIMGRLRVSRDMGGGVGTGATSSGYTSLFSFGARSFSIWNASEMFASPGGWRPVFDSGSQMERATVNLIFANANLSAGASVHNQFLFNSQGNPGTCDARSAAKGPEPEEVVVIELGGKTLAIVGCERISGIFVYDVTNPASAKLESFTPGPTSPQFVAPEGLAVGYYTDANGGQTPILLVAFEGRDTDAANPEPFAGLAVFQIDGGNTT